jgi:hypothetical protein
VFHVQISYTNTPQYYVYAPTAGLVLCLCWQIVLLIYIKLYSSKRNVKTYICLTKYVTTKTIQQQINVEHTNQ